jgi:hypothetical protein
LNAATSSRIHLQRGQKTGFALLVLTTRVTRLGKFLQIEMFYFSANFINFTLFAQSLRIFVHQKVMFLNLANYGLGFILGDLFTKRIWSPC